MKILWFMISMFVIYCPIFAQSQNENYDFWRPVLENKYPIVVDAIHDADTFTDTNIFIPEFNFIITKQTIRMSNFDACEINRVRQTVIITDNELEKGKLARDFVVDLLKRYQPYIVLSPKRDAYGRMLGKIYLSDKEHPNQFLDLRDLIFFKGFDRSQLPQ